MTDMDIEVPYLEALISIIEKEKPKYILKFLKDFLIKEDEILEKFHKENYSSRDVFEVFEYNRIYLREPYKSEKKDFSKYLEGIDVSFLSEKAQVLYSILLCMDEASEDEEIFFWRLDRINISKYMNVSIQTVGKKMKELKDKGLITKTKSSYYYIKKLSNLQNYEKDNG